MGKSIAVTQNVNNSETIWYTTRIREYIKFNTLTTFENVDTKAWDFYQRKETYNF